MDFSAVVKEFGGTLEGSPARAGGDFAAIAKEFGGVLEKPSIDLADVPGRALASAPASAAKFAGNLAQAGLMIATKPVSTGGAIIKGVGDTLAGGLRAGAQKALPEQVFKFLDQFDSPETTKRITDTAQAFGGAVAKRYGSWEAIKNSVADDPFEVAGDLATLLTGGQFATLRAAPTVSNAFGRVATQVDPTMIALRTGVGSVNALRSAAENIPNFREGLTGALRPYVDPGAVAVNQFVRAAEDPGATAAALRATQNAFVTPGAPAMSVSERLVEGGVPSLGVASLEQGLAGASPKVGLQMRGRELEQQSAIQQQLARVEQQIQTQAASLAPADLSQLRQVRDTLMRGLADEQATLANTAQGVAQPLPTVRQADVGGEIQTRGAERSEQLKKEYIRPGYREAFDIAGDAPLIDLGRPLATAERFVRDIGAIVDPTKVSPGVRNMLRLEAGPDAGPRVVSLEDFQAVRAALRKQKRDAARTDPTRASSLQAVIREMDAALEVSSVPKAAKDALLEADRRVSEVQIPMYRTGETGKMLTSGSYNQPRTLPSQQVEAFIKTEEAAEQFVLTFKDDPRALQSLQQGILDLYRQDIVNPTTRAVDPKRAAKFEADKARELDILEAAGLNVRETMEMVRRDAAAVQRATEALTKEASKFSAAKSADEVVDLALKSPSNMTSVRDRLTPTARTALSDELTNRATSDLERGDAAGALDYLTKNEKAIKIGMGKAGAKTYGDLVELANLQKDFLDVLSQAPKTSVSMPVTIPDNLTAGQLTSLKVVVDDLARAKAVTELGTPKNKAAGKGSTEAALEAGAAPNRIPGFMTPVITAAKSVFRSILDFQDRRVAAILFDKMVKDPDSLIPALEAAAKVKAATPAVKQPPRPLTIPVGVERAARGATAVNSMSSQENQNAMAR
jgi:hypothetical protein